MFSCKQKNDIFKGGYFKFKDDDSYNDYILYLNQIIGVYDEKTWNF